MQIPDNFSYVVRADFLFHSLKIFTASVAIILTGSKQYPATTAQGTPTITNGSILSEELPKSMILTGKGGVEVTIDRAVFVPAGSAEGFGVATVQPIPYMKGKEVISRQFDINQVQGTSLFIRNSMLL